MHVFAMSKSRSYCFEKLGDLVMNSAKDTFMLWSTKPKVIQIVGDYRLPGGEMAK